MRHAKANNVFWIYLSVFYTWCLHVYMICCLVSWVFNVRLTQTFINDLTFDELGCFVLFYNIQFYILLKFVSESHWTQLLEFLFSCCFFLHILTVENSGYLFEHMYIVKLRLEWRCASNFTNRCASMENVSLKSRAATTAYGVQQIRNAINTIASVLEERQDSCQIRRIL